MTKRAYIGVGGKARKVKKIYLGADNFERRTLPEGYTQVEFIESSGTQYIDTGYRPNQSSRLVLDFEVTSFTQGAAVFGARDPGTSPTRAFNLFTSSEKVLRSMYCGSMLNFDATVISRHVIDHNGRSVSIGEAYQSHQERTFSVTCNLLLLAVNHGGEAQLFTKAKIRSCMIYDNGTSLVRDFVPCTNADGVVGLYDLVSKSFFANAGTGTFTKGPVNKTSARKVKRAYVGVGGVARPFFAGGDLVYLGRVGNLPIKRYQSSSARAGSHALFGGGGHYDSSNAEYYSNKVHAVTENFVVSSLTSLPAKGRWMASGTFCDQAFFGFGFAPDSATTSTYQYVDRYDAALVKHTCGSFRFIREGSFAGTNSEYIIFIGGYWSNNQQNDYHSMPAYNKSFTQTTIQEGYLWDHAVSSVGRYVLFCGGVYRFQSQKKAFSYDESLVKMEISANNCGTDMKSAKTEKNAFFMGDHTYGSPYRLKMEVFNENLISQTFDLPFEVMEGVASVGVIRNNVIANNYSYGCIVIDENFVKTNIAFQDGLCDAVSSTVGETAILACGYYPNNPNSTMMSDEIFAYAII